MLKKILLVAGEASGDLYGAHLVRSLKKKYPEAKFLGVGGIEMKNAGVEIVYPIGELAIIGVSEIFSKLGKIRGLFRLLHKKVDEERFDLAILVNYPGFNLRFARILKKRDIPVVFYSSPQVWAWGKWRVNDVKRFVDKMVVFFKFEKDLYRRCGVEAEFVGHPLVDIVRPRGEDLGVKKVENLKAISLVPGSRESEIKYLFQAMLDTAEIIYSKIKNVQFLVTKHRELPYEIYQKILKRYNLPVKLIDGNLYDCLNISDIAIAASGSVTLEAAILKVPMIIINRVSLLTGILFLIFARMADVGLVNIIARKRIMPEFLQYRATGRNIAKESLDILSNKERYKKMKGDLEDVSTLLGPPGASDRAAEIIGRMLDK